MTVLPAPDLLAAERDEVNARLATLRADLDAMQVSSTDSNADDEHDPEGSTIAFERAQLESMVDAATTQLAEIDAAEQRVESGTYGVCERCEQPIADARLEALPSTRFCVTCAAELERLS